MSCTGLPRRGTKKLILGDPPILGRPTCLPQHVDDIQQCSTKRSPFEARYNNADRRAATLVGGRYVSVTSWFCASRCSAVIGRYDVYFNFGHVAVGYTRFLEGVLAKAIDLPSYEVTAPQPQPQPRQRISASDHDLQLCGVTRGALASPTTESR